MIKEGIIVSRNKYNNDIKFRVIKIEDNVAYLEGINERLCADSSIDDLKEEKEEISDDEEILDRLELDLDRNNYFYIPGKILHIDTDNQLSNNATNPYKIRENTNFKTYKKSQKKQKINNFS